MGKVYCKDCKHFYEWEGWDGSITMTDKLGKVIVEACQAPENNKTRGNYKSPSKITVYQRPGIININNDCKWYCDRYSLDPKELHASVQNTTYCYRALHDLKEMVRGKSRRRTIKEIVEWAKNRL